MSDIREPRVFSPDDPKIVGETAQPADDAPLPLDEEIPPQQRRNTGASVGGLFLSAVAALAGLALTVSFANFVSTALARDGWVGWTALSLLVIAIGTGLIILGREIIGLVRLRRLTRLRRNAETAIRTRDIALERKTVAGLSATFRGRRDLTWNLARLRDHAGDVRDPGDLLRLADREVIAPLDTVARRLVLKSAKRVSVVTAMSPMVWVAMLYVMVENLRLLRGLATLYGGRPGGIGALRIARLVITHIVATGGLAMTDDLLGQFLGQDLLRRLSRRLGEGVFNGALTARVGVAAIEVTRPIPFLDSEPIRVRDLLPELLRRSGS
ncbi:TIGR01620 family protein [Hyphomicrobium sp. LHD-15]|uniref:TIGR01620 family protein n=1 Tax=Hyphomicrobium sp. LHD-15 TaxID=3072142 RepID=UPI00280E1E56|nr:TIGR01620 family protein [Hyphomicrobium sp. LHD-15]MDQ8697185.1 TIGR01620 family protein [Hyphomicrobium sp. LHD-15]